MFYINTLYEDEILSCIKEEKKIIVEIERIGNKQIQKAKHEIIIALVIKSTNYLEFYFDDIILEFAKSKSSVIFHSYFQNNFKKNGRNVSPDRVNSLLKNIGVDPIKRNKHVKEYTSLESLYNIRNNIAHEECNVQDTFEQIVEYITYSLKFMKILIEKLNKL